ncbi:zinc finger protein 345-like [Malaya genurostris]|uniref:zinc finger protein 345-like n=1 Tax=Malaya genurostris TaxID=325434 RepID=UPI0026F3CB80|nr:zinc finger protein 345-like [Malaya genurostris]
MPCCVQQCPEGSELVSFPKHEKFQKRWQDAIRIGSGTKVVFATDNEPQICASHFPYPEECVYQEPTFFVDSTGQQIQVASCRLCFRFQPVSEMFSVDGQLASLNIGNLITTALKVRVRPYDFLQQICRECLVKVDLVRRVQSQFLIRDVQYRDLEMMKVAFKPQQTLVKIEPDCPPDPMEISPEDMLESKITVEEMTEVVKTEKVKREPSSRKQPKIKKPNNPIMDKPRKKYKTKELKKVTTKKIWLRTIGARTCYICSSKVEFENTDDLNKHLTEEHVGQIDYACELCDGKSFPVVSGYNNHLSLHDASVRPLKCSFCSLRYSTKKGLQVHENKLHGANHQLPKECISNRVKPQCEYCGKFFPSLVRAREHRLVVHENKVVAECKICLKTFMTSANLRRHMLLHTNELPYACETCGVRFRVSTDLTKHILADHQGKTAYHCNACNLPLQNKTEYYRHRNRVHLKPHLRPFKCRLCLEVPLTAQDLEAHIEACHPTEDYPYRRCTVCEEKFFNSMKLGVHMRSKHGIGIKHSPARKSYVCDHCGKEYIQKHSLQIHLANVHNAEKAYSCDMCDKRFVFLSNLTRHQEMHKQIKRFACDFCDKTFSQKTAMMNHRRNIHTGETAFDCPYCGAAFKESSTFYRHKAACKPSAQ